MPQGRSGSSVSVTAGLAMAVPSLPESRDSPFCALSAENTPQKVESRSAMALLRITTRRAPLCRRPAPSFSTASFTQPSATAKGLTSSMV